MSYYIHTIRFGRLLLWLCILNVEYIWSQEHLAQPYRNAGDLRIFYSLDDVKSIFRSPEYSKIPCCRAVLDAFEIDCCPYAKRFINKEMASSRFPFIVFDGNHRLSTSILSKRFSKIIRASYYSMCPTCLKAYRTMFTKRDLLLRRAFFALAVNALGCQAAESLQSWPVVISNYWNHQAVFALTTLLNDSNIPEPGDPVYSMWPEDLPKPDLLFYINFPDDMHKTPVTTRPPNSWKPRILQFYKRIQSPLTIEISTKNGWDEALKEVQEHVKTHLGTKKQFVFRNLKFSSSGKNNTYVILS